MNFSSQNNNKVYKTLIHANLLMVEYGQNRIEFSLFNYSHQEIIKKTQFQNSDLQSGNITQYDKSLYEIFISIQRNPQQMISFFNNLMTLKVHISEKQAPLIFDLQLNQNRLPLSQSILFMKQYITCKESFYKNEILKLKSKIYSLMTEVQDATNLIRSQSAQAKGSKQQVKNLKKQLLLLQEEKKKQQQTFFVEVGVQHSYSTQINDIIECLERPQLKQFSFDQQKMKNLTRFIEQQIKESEKIFNLASQNLPCKQQQEKRFLSQPKITFQTQQPKVSFSPQKVYLFEKPADHFTIGNYSLKTLETV